jgi:PrgI family protein
MKKEEFPTFLNEQPTVVFGRTARELLFIACSIVVAWNVWGATEGVLGSPGALFLRITLAALPAIFGIMLAMVYVGYRPLEEWLFVWLLYTFTPKIFLYKPLEETIEQDENERRQGRRYSSSAADDAEEE